ncbi:MAG TPA: M1 family metallopeptidase [Candidatus Saccharimonadia bacterium]|nr:M1 family metallopeptidase [Candidatus Saccharimonadia bacterium]
MKSVARLYTQFQPQSYDIVFRLDEDAMRFSGTVAIRGKKTGRPAQRITFHQNGLTITHASITKYDKRANPQELTLSRINNQDSLNEVRLHTSEMAYPGEYLIQMEFEAPITVGMTGIYPCFFKDGEIDKQLLATQFESHHAREAFPCIDEPEAKATFDLTLVTRPGVAALSNTPVRMQEEKEGKLVTTFEQTPKMSCYLLAFVTGEMISKSTETASGTTVSIWATPVQPLASFDFALDVAKRSIEFFEGYFGVPYPLAKADHVALPDFSSGAMENWGLVTYRERLLLAYPDETAQSTREQIALVVAHETSHQWFGNFVTMKWWDDLWLNESFANMMEYQAIDAMFPEWHVWTTFVAAEALSALRRDAVVGVQAVRTAVHHPDEISALFDPSIVYAKGGRLLYMLKSYIGEDAFRRGLKNYFEKHAYGNTTGADLWASLSEASGKDAGAFMDPWLTRNGFPMVSVTQHGSSVTIEQQHFLDSSAKADLERLWPIPLFTNLGDQPDELHRRKRELTLTGDTPLLLNTEGRGHYLVRYATDAQKQAVIDLVRKRQLGESDRLMLLNGGSMMSRAGYESFSSVLTMLDAYTEEASEPVWDIMALIIGEARRFIDLDEALEAKIKLFVSKLVAAQVARLGWEEQANEPVADTKLRALVLGLSTYAEDTTTVNKATKLFAAYKDANTQPPAELRALVFIVPVKNGDREAFDFLLNLHDTTKNSDLQSDACSALTATRDPELAKQLLLRLKDSKIIKPQDVDHWLVYLLRNRYTRATTWEWMVENWSWLEETFKNDKGFDYLPRYAASCVNTREYQQKFHDLFDDKQDLLLLKRNIQLGFEEIETRVRWLERDLASVQQFFS